MIKLCLPYCHTRDKIYQALPFLSGKSLGTRLTHYINAFLHTEEKREIELELQAERKRLAEEKKQHGQCRREFAEARQEYMRKY